MYLLFAFVIVPIIEIALFVEVGGAIGLWPTLAIVFLTAFLGIWLIRTQGRLALQQLQASFSTGKDPTKTLVHGAMILIAGFLLLTPGFFTDAIGFALMIPPVRMAVFRFLQGRINVQGFQTNVRSGFSGGDVIDGDFEEVQPTKPTPGKPSGWVEGPDRH
ncbi:MAG: FxsA family protein [Rhodobacteraceae bacterium]|nr:FxsA family protein [Paracoccaceae bacterium]